VQEVGSSNLPAPTINFKIEHYQADLFGLAQYHGQVEDAARVLKVGAEPVCHPLCRPLCGAIRV